jgi:hypothetical protein
MTRLANRRRKTKNKAKVELSSNDSPLTSQSTTIQHDVEAEIPVSKISVNAREVRRESTQNAVKETIEKQSLSNDEETIQSTKHDQRKRKFETLGEQPSVNSSSRHHQLWTRLTHNASSDEQKVESMLQQVDDEIEIRIAALQTMRDQQAASLRRQLNMKLLTLPEEVRKMTVKEWRDVYNDDLDKFVQIKSSSGEKKVDLILQQTNPMNTTTASTVTDTDTSERNIGKKSKDVTVQLIPSIP